MNLRIGSTIGHLFPLWKAGERKKRRCQGLAIVNSVHPQVASCGPALRSRAVEIIDLARLRALCFRGYALWSQRRCGLFWMDAEIGKLFLFEPNYGFTIGALTLKSSDFCNIGV